MCYCYATEAFHETVVKTVKSLSSNEKLIHSPLVPRLSQWLCAFRNKYSRLIGEEASTSVENVPLYVLFEAVAKERIRNIFKLMVHYPDSSRSLIELKDCIDRVPKLKPVLATEIKTAISRRLLHAGVATTEILTAYVAVVKTCRLLLDLDSVVASITRPITDYLRKRNDTIRCLVISVVDEDNDIDLSSFDSLNYSMDFWKTWQPPSTHIDSIDLEESHKDTFNALVDDLGGADLLVKEYAKQLAERMLASPGDLRVDDEIKRIETLKLKFGEPALSACDVMMVDLKESSRIRSCLKKEQTNALILSEHYWPKLQEEEVVLPPEIENRFEEFTNDYQKVKEGRTLKWHKQLGTINMRLELGDKSLNVAVSPAHSALLHLFTVKDEPWSLGDLARESGMTSAAVKRRMNLWLKEGVISPLPDDRFELNTTSTRAAVNESMEENPEEEDEKEEAAKAPSPKKGNVNTVWMYIQGVLRTMESVPKDKLLKILAMFSAHFSQLDIQNLLANKVKNGQLIFSDGVYRLPTL
ncbi:unnamed protein product [Dimorphilus gyrociliatus]|nr:unnamed protein product [Dimorphilus gyrociliatus]